MIRGLSFLFRFFHLQTSQRDFTIEVISLHEITWMQKLIQIGESIIASHVQEEPLKKKRKRPPSKFGRRRRWRRPASEITNPSNSSLDVKVCLEKSCYIENLIQEQLSTIEEKTCDGYCLHADEVSEELSTVDLPPITNKPDVSDVLKETESHKLTKPPDQSEMKAENQEKSTVIPLNLPAIQITVTTKGEKTTRLIAPKKDDPQNEKAWKRTWKRESSKWMDDDLFRITSKNNIFSNAILGKEDSLTFPFCDTPNTPKRSKLLLIRPARAQEQQDGFTSDILTCDSGIVTASECSTPERDFHERNSLSPFRDGTAFCVPSSNVIFTQNDSFLVSSKHCDLSSLKSANVPPKQGSDVQSLENSFINCDTQAQLKLTVDPPVVSSPMLSDVSIQTKIRTELCTNSVSEPKESTSQQQQPTKHSPIHFIRSETPEEFEHEHSSTPVMFNNQGSMQNSPVSNKSFKMPFLPKRPPGRMQKGQPFNKFTDLRSILTRRNKECQRLQSPLLTFANQDDDAISLYAESLPCEPENSKQRNETLRMPPIMTITSDTTALSEQTASDTQQVKKQPIPINLTNNECTSKTSPVNTESRKVDNWIVNSEKFACAFIDTYKLLLRRCYCYLKYGKCYVTNCRYIHELPILPSNINDVSEAEFQKLSVRCFSFHYMFENWFDLLLSQICEHGRYERVLSLVGYAITLSSNKMPFFKKIITSLKNMGFSFDKAINEILLAIGRQNECLLDILLSFAVDEENCLKTNWGLITNLTNHRARALDIGVVQDIFQKCIDCEPPDQDFCENIYKDIIIKNNFDLSKINETITQKYISLLAHFKLDSYVSYIRVNFNQENDSDVNSFSSASSNNPKSSSSARLPSPNTEVFEYLDNMQLDVESVALGDNFGETTPVPRIEGEIAERESTPDDYSTLSNSYLPTYNSHYSKLEVANYLDNIRSEDSGNSTQKFSTSSISYGSYYTEQPAPYVPKNQTNSITSLVPNSTSSLVEETPANIAAAETVESNGILDTDITTLVHSIRTCEWSKLLTVIKRNSVNQQMAQDLVIHILAAIKKFNYNDERCQFVSKMFEVLGEYCQSDHHVIDVLRLLGFNLLPMFEAEQRFNTISDILNIFMKDFHCFVKYDYVVRSYGRINGTNMKYVRLIEVLSKCGRYKEALRLLKHPESKLVNAFFDAKDSDANKHYKLCVLNELVKTCLSKSVLDAKDLIIYLMLNINIESWSELKIHINVLISTILQSYSTLKAEVINMLDNILNLWYRYLKPSVLRALLINLYSDVSEKKVIELFHLCIDIGVYPVHEGKDNSISIPSDLVLEEIFLQIHYHLLKICSLPFPITNIIIKVEVPLPKDDHTEHHTVLIRSCARSTADMVRRILNVLMRIKNFPPLEKVEVSNQYIVLDYNDLFLQPFKQQQVVPPLLKLR